LGWSFDDSVRAIEACMPEFRIDGTVVNIPRNALLLDTNVLFAAFYPHDDASRHEYAKYLIEEDDTPLLVSTAVVVETWGLLVGSYGARVEGHDLLTWLNRPGRATLIPPHRADLNRTQQLVQGLWIDCVDAMLAELATTITILCELDPALAIATFDARDFFRMTKRQGLQLTIFDMRTLERTEIG